MKLIGAGLGRTGTKSTKKALEILGFAPCYHMEEVIKKPSRIKLWSDIFHAKDSDRNWAAVFNGYSATVDFPAAIYYKELMTAFPDAKVLLNVRDSEKWYASTVNTIYKYSQRPETRWLPYMGDFHRLTTETVWDAMFEGKMEDKAHTIAVYEKHNADVIAHVPADKLLVFSVKEGWEPLCAFLDVPIPDQPFPHVNDTKTMQRQFGMMRAVAVGVPLVALLAVVLVLWRLFA